MWILLSAALAGPNSLPALSLDGNRVLIDGERVPIPRARPYLIADVGSRPIAKKAKRTGLTGRIISITGASVMVLGAVSMSMSESTSSSATTSGLGTVFVGTGIAIGGSVVTLRSHSQWKRSIADYRQEPWAP